MKFLYAIIGFGLCFVLSPAIFNITTLEFKSRELAKLAYFSGCVTSERQFSPDKKVTHAKECEQLAIEYRKELDRIYRQIGD